MKYFALIFLFGLASASLLDIYPDSDEEDFLLKSDVKGTDKPKTELVRDLRKTLDRILKQIEETIKEGKEVSQELYDEAKDVVHKLKSLGEDVQVEVKQLISYFEKRVQRWAEELLKILREDKTSTYSSEPKVNTELARKLRDEFKKIVHQIKQLIKEGKEVSQDLWDKFKNLALRLKDYGVNVVDEFGDMFQLLKERYHDWIQRLLDIIKGKDSQF